MKKVFVKKDDYDFYSIPLPVGVLSRRNRRNFLLREIEKRHPCFSSGNCFDSRLKIKKRSLFAEVVVMEKSKLFEYKNAFPSEPLFLEGRKNRCVFRKKKNVVKLAVSMLALSVAAVALHAVSKSGESPQSAEVAKIIQGEEDYVFLSPQDLFMLVFASVSKNGGKINSMEWSGDKCVFNVSGCPSEEIAGAKYCQVSYKNGEPNFLIQNDGMKIRRAEFDDYAESGLLRVAESASPLSAYGFVAKGKSFVPEARSALLSLGCVILSEQVAEDSCRISFFSNEESFSQALGVLAACAFQHGLCEKSIRVENGGLYPTVSVSFEKNTGKDFESSSPLSVCARYSALLCRKNSGGQTAEVPETKPKVSPVYTIERRRTDGRSNRLGSIIAKDGRVFAYYKSNDGKIKMEEENAH